jgi:hypothetical protein
MITPSIIYVTCNKCSVRCIDMRYVAHEISTVNISSIIELKSNNTACTIDKVYSTKATGLSYEFSINVIISKNALKVNLFIKTPHPKLKCGEKLFVFLSIGLCYIK